MASELPLVEYELGNAGIQVFFHALSHGQPLASLLLRKIKSLPARITTWLPPDLSAESLRELAENGYRYWPYERSDGVPEIYRGRDLVPVPDRDFIAADFIEGFFARRGPGSVCIVEDFAAKRAGTLQFNCGRVLYHGEFPYYILPWPYPGRGETETFLGEGAFFEINYGACLVWPEAEKYLQERRDLSSDDLSRMASLVEALFVQAFDCEGYIFWSARSNLAAEAQ